MKKYRIILLVLLLLLTMTACRNETEHAEDNSTIQDESMPHMENNEPESITESEPESFEESEEDEMKVDQLYIKVGESTLTVVLEDNESVCALRELLADGPLTISASNYGGFEKVCSLGTKLPRNDIQTTTQAGDICLYNGNQIVIFYGSNSWAYTKLGRVSDRSAQELESILSGEETEITLSLDKISG